MTYPKTDEQAFVECLRILQPQGITQDPKRLVAAAKDLFEQIRGYKFEPGKDTSSDPVPVDAAPRRGRPPKADTAVQ